MFPATTIRFRGLIALVLVLPLLAVLVAPSPAQANPRYASIVVDYATGEVIHASNADARRYPASLTKMMTLYLLFEALEQGAVSMNQEFRVSPHAASMPPSKLGLRAGTTIKAGETIQPLIVRSANDVAVVVGEALAGTESAFARKMTEKARQMGMHSTTFRNASGLPNSGQVTTARDMATLAKRVMQDFPQYYHYFDDQSFTYRGQTHTSHNRLIRSYNGADGLKTGYIRASGFNVATSAARDGRRLIGVVMGGRTAQSRNAHMADLLDRGFQRADQLQLAKARPIPPVPAARPIQVAVSDAMARGESDAPRHIGGMLISSAQAAVSDEVGNAATQSLNGRWSVQVGAFQAPDQAQSLASQAVSRLSGDLGKAMVAISEVQVSNQTLFRARLIGFMEGEAHNACQHLSNQGMDCMVIRPTGS